MTDVRTLIQPLFPGVPLEDSDRLYVEKTSIPVGPQGSQARDAVQKIFREETFADDDILVVETDRLLMSDEVVLPGEQNSDEFDGAAGSPVNELIWKPQPLVTLDGVGHAVFPATMPTTWLELLNASPLTDGAVGAHWAHFGNTKSGLNNSALLQVRRASNPANYYIQMSVSGNMIGFYINAFGMTKQTIPLDQVAHAHWRIRFADQLYYETSPDGTAWTTRWTRPLPAWIGEATGRRVGSGPYQTGGNSTDKTLLGSYFEA